MDQKENINILLLYIHKLEDTVTQIKNTEIYPASFFDQTMELTSRIIEELNLLESNQIETLQNQLEAHKALLKSVRRENHSAEKMIISTEASFPTSTFPNIPQPSEKKEEDTKTVVVETPHEPEKSTEIIDKSFEKEKTAALTEQRQSLSFNDILEKNNLSDFKKAFSLNDRFRFRRELFNNEESKMDQVINDLNGIHTLDESMMYLSNQLHWDMDNQSVKDFVQLLEKRFL